MKLSTDLAANSPGSGLIKNQHQFRWIDVIAKLPEAVAGDPSARFPNPALIDTLEDFIKKACEIRGAPNLSYEHYQQLASAPVTQTMIDDLTARIEKLHTQRPENPYHSLQHTLSEVPDRLLLLYMNLKDPSYFTGNEKLVGVAAAKGHDLLHAGVGYAQRLTLKLNISNEERACIWLAKIALEVGFNAVQVLEMQRQILPTAFFQKPAELKIAEDPNATFKVIGDSEATIPKARVARDYFPDLPTDTKAQKSAQFLALADVLVTTKSFEEWTKTAGLLFLEAKIGSGFFPPSPLEFSKAQSGFICNHVKNRLEAAADILSEEFVSQHLQLINQYSKRLLLAGQICEGDLSRNTPHSAADSKLLAHTVAMYLNAELPPPNADFLDFSQLAS